MVTTKPHVIIYTDGGCKPNPGHGGWAALLIYADHQKEFSDGSPNTTNNQMELTAAIMAFEALNKACDVDFYTDSNYLKNGITKWIFGWIKKGWRTTSGKPVKNQELWQRLHRAMKAHTIIWHWTRGHAGNRYNERVDRLATAARIRIENQS
jgi:ribonuclease HI